MQDILIGITFLTLFVVCTQLFFDFLEKLFPSFTLSSDGIVIRVFYPFKIKYSDIKKVTFHRFTWLNSFALYVGFRLYNQILIERYKGIDIVISPTEPEKFVESLKAHIKRL